MRSIWLPAILLAGLIQQGEFPDKKYELAFTPKHGDVLVVEYCEDTQWDYKDHDMKGQMRTELLMRWRIIREGEEKGFTGKAAFERVAYRGDGVKSGRNFDHDIEWCAKKGYLKGEGSEADKKWTAKEIKEGVTLKFDGRGACEPGLC